MNEQWVQLDHKSLMQAGIYGSSLVTAKICSAKQEECAGISYWKQNGTSRDYTKAGMS